MLHCQETTKIEDASMLKDTDHPRKESAEQRALRMWSNYDLTKRFLEEVNKKESVSQPVKTEPEIGEVITTEKPRPDSVSKFQRKFIKDFKSMLNEHKRRNVLLYRHGAAHQIGEAQS
jgi:hypothetical protein